MVDVFVTLDLSKDEFIRLVMSYAPSLKDVSRFEDDGLGKYTGGFVERWDWNENALMNLPEDDLISLYFYLCKEE